MSTKAKTARSAVVIGAGFSGLATAALLAREGLDVTVLETQDQVGGRAGQWHQDGFRFETGPSWYLMPEVFEHFFRLCGSSVAEQLDLVSLDPRYRVFFDEHQSFFDLPDEEPLQALTSLGADTSRLGDYLRSGAETYHLAVEKLLYSTFSSPQALLQPEVLGRLPRLLRLLGEPLDRFIARHSRDPRIQKILGYPAVFLGTSPAAAPSMYHLMSHLDINDAVRYPRGGFSAVVEAVKRMALAQGAHIRTGCTAQHITSRARRTTGVHFTTKTQQREFLAADVVVSTADMHVTENQLLQPQYRTRSERAWKRRDPGPGAVLAMLGVQGPLPELAHHSLFFTQDWERGFDEISGKRQGSSSPRSLYVCRPSATDDVAPPGHENLFVLVPVTADTSIGGGGIDGAGSPAVEHIVDESIEQISAWANIPDLAQRIVVRRSVGPEDFARDFGAWRGGALGPAHTLAQSAFLRGPIGSPRLRGLFYAGATTMPGIGVPMCLISAELVLKALRGDRRSGPVEVPDAA